MAARPAGGREVAPGELGERGEDEGAEDRPQRRARAAHDRTDDDLHGKRDAEERAGLERELIEGVEGPADPREEGDRKSTRLNSSHRCISYAVFCLKKKKEEKRGRV